MDEKYHLVTLSLDSTHNLTNRVANSRSKLYSYKLKDFAYNVLVS